MGLSTRVLAGLTAPTLRSTTFAARGFLPQGHAKPELEAIPQAVVTGFEWGMGVSDLWELHRRLALVDRAQQGFAYEGATMASTILDAMTRSGGRRTRELMLGPGRPHTLLNLIGVGFAMARLPRMLWKDVLPELPGLPTLPVASWLAVDGYAFDRAYFDTDVVVHGQQRPDPYPWEGDAAYFARAADQGIGRALWFITNGVPEQTRAAVLRCAAERQRDLWSGVGLAATFAGGCDAQTLQSLTDGLPDGGSLDDPRRHLAQGAAFAAKARVDSGFVPDHSRAACLTLTGGSPESAAALVDEGIALARRAGGSTAYEGVRAHVRSAVGARVR
ncbi:MAG: DUF1702 family protein [Knoellia sp.]